MTMLKLSAAARSRQLPRRPAAEARIFSKRIAKALASHGVVPRKTASMELGVKAAVEPAVWLGVLDGDGSVGIYRNGRLPRLMFAGSRPLVKQCEKFWRFALRQAEPRPTTRPHSRGIWTYTLWGRKAATAAQLLLASSPISMRRKRSLLMQIAEYV
jgi:hypothetical protein